MEKSRSFPEYSCSYSGGLGYEGRTNSYSFNGPSGKGDGAGFASSGDPELKRKRRVASYNGFTVEAKLKSSVRNSVKWIKSKLTDIRYGL